ncbi:MAG: sialidase family protein [Actinomycetota bacterium]
MLAVVGTQARVAAAVKGRDHFPTPGWRGSTLWHHRQDDWEPALAAGPASNDVYQLGTRYYGPRACGSCPPIAIIFRRSSDGGRTWGPDRFLCRCAGRPNQFDPQIEVDGRGTVFAAFLQGFTPGVTFMRSDDRGRTWTKPVSFRVGWSDKPVLAVSGDGKDVYIAFNGPAHGDSYVAQSHDGGRRWTSSKITKNERYFFAGGGFVAPDGTVTFAENTTNQDYTGNVQEVVETSSDRGKTWRVVKLDVTKRQPDCTSRGCYDGFYATVPAIAGDANGNLVDVYVGASVPRGPQRAYVRRSTDGGLTWSRREAISPADAIAVSSAAVGGGPGDIRVWYMDDRTGAFNVWERNSTDGGRTWSPVARLSNALGGPGYVSGRGFGEIYGDYGEIDITARGKTVATWGEAGSYYGPGGIWFNSSR